MNLYDIINLDSDISKEYTKEGYLKIKGAVLSRTGFLDYKDGQQLRPADEVFKQSHLDSIIGKPITTNGHPKEMVNNKNYKNYQIGTITNAYQDGELLRGDLIISEPNKIGENKELSLGYSLDLKDENGIKTQRNLYVNHLSLVRKARAGSITRINLDSEEFEKDYKIVDFNNMGNIKESIDANMSEDLKKENEALKSQIALKDKEIEGLKNSSKIALDEKDAIISPLKEKVKSLEDGIKKVELISNAKSKSINLDGIDEKLSYKDLLKEIIKKSEVNKSINLDEASEDFLMGMFYSMQDKNNQSFNKDGATGNVNNAISDLNTKPVDAIAELNKISFLSK
jgi:hypothetical protein